MKKFIPLLIAFIFFSTISFAQENNRNFGKILQTYYLFKDQDLVEKTIDFVNHTPLTYAKMEPLLTGFFGALYIKNPAVQQKIAANLEKIQNPEIKKLFTMISAISIDSIYAKMPISPSYNDMNWSSYFATGDVSYLDKDYCKYPTK